MSTIGAYISSHAEATAYCLKRSVHGSTRFTLGLLVQAMVQLRTMTGCHTTWCVDRCAEQ